MSVERAKPADARVSGPASARASKTRAPRDNAIRWVETPKAARAGQVREPVRESGRTKRGRRGASVPADGMPNRPPRATAGQEHPASRAAIPESVRAHFVQVGRDYFFSDGARAFTDKQQKLTTPSENTQVIRDLVAIAQARGWRTVAVSGSERFRKEAWIAAREAGLAVRGYRASKFDETRLVRRVAREGEAASAGDPRSRGVREPGPEEPQRPRQHVGRLIEHGPAPYQHNPRQPMSYFAKLETEQGERELWGVDLERAFQQSLSRPQPGDEVVLRAVRRDPVTVKTPAVAGEGAPKELATHRNRWQVEKKAFLERREEAAQVLRNPAIAPAQASQTHPELIGAYLQVHAAELAARQFRDATDRERFVAMVRGAVADAIARGEPLPAVRMRESEVERRIDEKNARALAQLHARGRGRGHE